MIDSWDWLRIGRENVWAGPRYHGATQRSLRQQQTDNDTITTRWQRLYRRHFFLLLLLLLWFIYKWIYIFLLVAFSVVGNRKASQRSCQSFTHMFIQCIYGQHLFLSGAIGGPVSCPRTLWQADGEDWDQIAHLLVAGRPLYPLSHVPVTKSLNEFTGFWGQSLKLESEVCAGDEVRPWTSHQTLINTITEFHK